MKLTQSVAQAMSAMKEVEAMIPALLMAHFQSLIVPTLKTMATLIVVDRCAVLHLELHTTPEAYAHDARY